MISKIFIIYGQHLIFLTAITGAGLVNDTCHKVWIREDITQKAAKLNCSDTARVYDPKSQNGSYLLEDTGNWAGEIFACLCSCQLPSNPENGQILSKDRIYHGGTLNYSCNEGYEKSIETKIVCYDGLLMTVPGYLETQDINIFTRKKSLPDRFAHDNDGKVFYLWINESSNWSIPDTELQKNQKVFQLFKNETSLQYYMCRGKGCILGCVNLGMGGPDCNSLGFRDLECKRNLTATTGVPTSQHLTTVDVPSIVGGVLGGVAGVGVVYVVVAYLVKRKCNKEIEESKEEEEMENLPVECKKESQNNPDVEELYVPLHNLSIKQPSQSTQ